MARRLCTVLGTRPEAIKLLPLILAARDDPRFDVRVCATAQHRQLLDQVLGDFDVEVDRDLDLMRPGQTLNGLASRAIDALGSFLAETKPDLVVVQGDTTTAFCAALAAFQLQIPVAHVEAGLRTGDLAAPWPEEANRQLIGRLAALHFAPTAGARDALLAEGVAETAIRVTGNTGIDALYDALDRIDPSEQEGPAPVVVTAHRRESLGEGLAQICRGITEAAGRHPGTPFVYPVHPNPRVQETVARELDAANVRCVEPLGYLPFVRLMSGARLLVTDSGGIQEEAPYLGKPVLVLRDKTERPEAVAEGNGRVVGTGEKEIADAIDELLSDDAKRVRMATTAKPFGDGRASGRILDTCAEYLQTS